MSEPLDLMNVLEIQRILKKCDKTETTTLKWIIKCANKSINSNTIKVLPFKIERYEEPDLSDHSSDDDLVLIEDSSDE